MSMPATSTKTTKLATSLIDEYALLGWRAMLTEVNLSPKPALWIALTAVRTKIWRWKISTAARWRFRAGYPVSLNLVPVVQKWHQKRYSTDYAQLVWLAKVICSAPLRA